MAGRVVLPRFSTMVTEAAGVCVDDFVAGTSGTVILGHQSPAAQSVSLGGVRQVMCSRFSLCWCVCVLV